MTRTRRIPFACPVPACGQPMDRLVMTRPRQGTIQRRRVCVAGHVVVTVERIQTPAA